MLKIGDKDAKGLYYGSSTVAKAFLGSTQVWPSLPYDAEVQWLQSTGTQWIDTGIYGNKNTVAKVIATSTITSGYSWIFGSRQYWNIRNFSFYNGAD